MISAERPEELKILGKTKKDNGFVQNATGIRQRHKAIAPRASDVEYAWAAGFIDGDGCFLLVGSRKKFLHLKISQSGESNLDPLYKMRRIFGGLITGPYHSKRRPHAQPIYTYRLGAPHVAYHIKGLWPYLSKPKKRQYKAKLEISRANGGY